MWFCGRYVKKQWIKLCEALFVAFMTASAGAASMYFLTDYCHSDTEESVKFAVRVRITFYKSSFKLV